MSKNCTKPNCKMVEKQNTHPLKDGGFICKGLRKSYGHKASKLPTTTRRTPRRTTTQTTTTTTETTDTTKSEPSDQFLTKTVSGHSCQAWNVQWPHRHTFGYVGSHNFCRNPDNLTGGVWCYTTNPKVRWELCTGGLEIFGQEIFGLCGKYSDDVLPVKFWLEIFGQLFSPRNFSID